MNKMMTELGAPMSATEQKAVPRAMDMLCEAIQSLEKHLAELESRLNPVLGQSHPVPCQEEKDPVRNGAPLAETIFEVSEQVHGATDFVRKILDRLEL